MALQKRKLTADADNLQGALAPVTAAVLAAGVALYPKGKVYAESPDEPKVGISNPSPATYRII